MKTKTIAVLLLMMIAMSLMLTGCKDDEFDDRPIKLTMEVHIPTGRYSMGKPVYEQVEIDKTYELSYTGTNPDISVRIKYKKQDVTAKVKDLIHVRYSYLDVWGDNAIEPGRYEVRATFNSVYPFDKRYNTMDIRFYIIITEPN